MEQLFVYSERTDPLMDKIVAIVIVKHWETEAVETFTFSEMQEAEKFATAIEEVDGKMSKWTGNTSESRALRKGHWHNTMIAEIVEIPYQGNTFSAALYLTHIERTWPENQEG